MSHTIKEKSKLLARVRRIKGQMEAIERALEAELGCAAIAHLPPSDYHSALLDLARFAADRSF